MIPLRFLDLAVLPAAQEIPQKFTRPLPKNAIDIDRISCARQCKLHVLYKYPLVSRN